jgi:hypothetical protein
MSRLERVWLILPSAEADDDWEPASVFETSEQAVDVLTADHEGHTVEVDVAADRASTTVTFTDDDSTETRMIVAVPIEYAEAT